MKKHPMQLKENRLQPFEMIHADRLYRLYPEEKRVNVYFHGGCWGNNIDQCPKKVQRKFNAYMRKWIRNKKKTLNKKMGWKYVLKAVKQYAIKHIPTASKHSLKVRINYLEDKPLTITYRKAKA